MNNKYVEYGSVIIESPNVSLYEAFFVKAVLMEIAWLPFPLFEPLSFMQGGITGHLPSIIYHGDCHL